MHVAIYLPLLVAAVLGATAPHLSRALPPATATRLLAGAAVATATATSFVLGVLTFTLVAEFGPVARLGSWSTSRLDASNPVPDGASVAAGATVCVLAFFVVRAVVRSVRATLAARRLCTELGGEPGDLVVIDGPDVRVFALPALRGRIVATRPLLAALPADERRAVLAHETAHLRNHHHRYRLAADLAAAVNPLLRPLARGVDYATERWADEAAAGTVGDRRVVARALARCGLGLRHSAPGAAEALHRPSEPSRLVHPAEPSRLVRRVEALLAPAPRHRPLLVAGVAALLVVTMVAVAETQRDTEHLFENASHNAAVAHSAAAHSAAEGGLG